MSALTSRSEGSTALGPEHVISSLTSPWFLWGEIALKQKLFFCNPCWKEATVNSSCLGVDLGSMAGWELSK